MLASPTKLLGLALLLTGLILACFGLSLLLGPPQFQATARIKIEPEPVWNANGAEEAPYDPYFIQTTLEIIQSELVLSNVVTTLNLETVWGNKFADGKPLSSAEAVALLRKQLILAPVRNTKIITISVHSTDPVEAAKLANAICDAYAHYCEETRKQLKAKGLKIFQQEYDDQTQEIQILRTNLDTLRKQLSITDFPDASDPQTQPYYNAKHKLEALTEQHKLFFEKLEAIRTDDLAIHDTPVLPVDIAVPPTSPVSLNRFYGAAMLAIGLITAFGGLSLLLSKGKTVD